MVCIEKRNKISPIIVRLLLFGIIFCFAISTYSGINEVRGLPDNLVLSSSDLASIDINSVSYTIEGENPALGSKNNKSSVRLKFKLFNLFTLKTVNATIENERKAYLGGNPVGLSVKAKGVVVVSKTPINTPYGKVTPQSEVEEGDIIVEVNGESVSFICQIQQIMSSFSKNDRFVELKVLREGKLVNVAAYPVIEELTGFYKLGIVVRDLIEGVGTLTYVKENGSFGSLGHSISGPGNSVVECMDGMVYDCKLLGYIKGARGVPGELKGSFTNTQKPIGTITTNNDFGVYGKINKSFSGQLYEIGSRFTIKNGKAKIRTTIDDKPVFYDIEIIKLLNQSSPQEKGMIIRVVDKKLLNKTGGILQGMSGSPIIQDGKIVGAVTHVMLSDPTKGYGVYLDFMYSH